MIFEVRVPHTGGTGFSAKMISWGYTLKVHLSHLLEIKDDGYKTLTRLRLEGQTKFGGYIRRTSWRQATGTTPHNTKLT